MTLGNLTQASLQRFAHSTKYRRLDVMGEREAEQARAHPWRRCLDPAKPGHAQLVEGQPIERSELRIEIQATHSGATPRYVRTPSTLSLEIA